MVLEERKQIFTNPDAVQIGEYWYSKEDNSIFFDLPYPFHVQLKITDWWKVEYTPGFKWLWTILRGGINLDIICRELDLIRFVQENKLMLHASCVAMNGEGTLIVGFPNAGKTYNTFKSLTEGCELISEEYTIIENGKASAYKPKCRSCLSARTLDDCKMPMTVKEQVHLWANTIRAKIFPFMFEAVIWKEFDVSGNSARVNNIVYGSTEVCVKKPNDLIYLTENEFPYMGEAILEAYAVASGFDLIGIQNRQRKLIIDFVKGVNNA